MQANKDPHKYSAHAVIMAGGKGTRLWPESTSHTPKQYLKLLSNKSLLQETLERFEGLVESERRLIVTTLEQEDLVKEHAQGFIGPAGIVFEPSSRDTAPCILLAMAQLEKEGASDDDIVSVVPSDHVILNTKGFQQTMLKAFERAATNQSIVTLGIPPHFPHTGYGYIQKGEEVAESAYRVTSFKEKPDAKTAQEYLKSGQYLWNSGMFIAQLGSLKREYKKHAPQIYAHYSQLLETLKKGEKLTSIYEKIQKISMDYAVMEKSQAIEVIPASFDWNDLGSWDALESLMDSQQGNTVVAAKDQNFIQAEGNIIYAPGKHVALMNVQDLVVVSNDKVVMVLPKKDSQKIRSFVEEIKQKDADSELL